MAQHEYKADLAKKLGISTAVFTGWLKRTVTEFNRRERARIMQHRPITANDVLKAVTETEGKDYYTGSHLTWKQNQRGYTSRQLRTNILARRSIWQVPTVDREDPFGPSPAIRLCSRRVAAIKTDENPTELVKLAIQIKDHLGLSSR